MEHYNNKYLGHKVSFTILKTLCIGEVKEIECSFGGVILHVDFYEKNKRIRTTGNYRCFKLVEDKKGNNHAP